ncbi:MAG: substrate-binding domain-containing protein [Clostridia bacterium]|nr:substrate-binding domain-containing protein [Clostridia bacterium]
MLYYIIEDKMKGYAWHQRQIQSLRDEMRKKHVPISELSSLDDLPQDDPEPCVIVTGVSENWENQTVTEARRRGALVIGKRRENQSGISSISYDGTSGVELAVRYLFSLGRTRLALYSVNPASTADPGSAAVFTTLTGGSGHVYENNGLLSELFSRLEPHLEEYDGIICTNGYAAISLVRHLKEIGRDPADHYIISLSDMHLFSRTSPTITAVGFRPGNYGAAVYALYRLLIQSELQITSVHLCTQSTLLIRESTHMEPFADSASLLPATPTAPATNSFFRDGEIQDIAKLETLLSQGDDIDHAIIEYLLSEKSNREIASLCFLSETAVKYRLKNMREACGQPDRDALIAYLKQYIAK